MSFLLHVKNSTNWPAPNVWVFIAQLVEHSCNANTKAVGSNPVEATPVSFLFFFWVVVGGEKVGSKFVIILHV